MTTTLSSSTLNHLLEGFQLISFDWRYLYVNDAVVRQSKFSREELIGSTMMEKYPGIEHTEMFTTLRHCMNERVVASIENNFTFPDGSIGWFELHVQPVPEGLFILSADITERKKAQIELANINQNLEYMVAQRTLQLEQKRREMQESLRYAKDIQRAFLNTKSELLNCFNEAFIIYKPKDIVSGDFYWCKKNDDSVLVAAADCTGHGVPGALMSMIGIEKLNQAANLTDEPNAILSRLNKSVKSTLQSKRSETQSNDGMDIVLCSFDAERRTVKYASANRPLWIMRKGSREIEQHRGIKCSIGGTTEVNQKFPISEVSLSAGDTLYMFSDGYADTFGGPSAKKLTTKRFRDMLTNIRKESLMQQESFLDSFIEDWKGENEQTDDILVIGVRV